MQIEPLTLQSVNQRKPNFTSIHPTRYFVKTASGEYQQVTMEKEIRSLQRKLIGWLNKKSSDDKKLFQIANNTAEREKLPIKDRVILYFKRNDMDYFKYPHVRSFYSKNSLGGVDSYILTGTSSRIVEDAAKPIGLVERDINDAIRKVMITRGLNFAAAKNYVETTQSTTSALRGATLDYVNTVKRQICSLLRTYNPKNTSLDVFFEPKTKGKKVNYELVLAKFKNGNF